MSDDAKKDQINFLGEFISKNDLTDGIDSARIQDSWHELMGKNINTYTQNVNLKNDVLVVKLSSFHFERN